MWKLPTTKGHPVFIPAVAYHMPDCDIRLFSPQSYFNLHGGDATVTAWSVVMRLPDNHVVNIPIDSTVNLPVIPHPQPTLQEEDNFGPHLLSSIVANTLHLSGLAKPVCCKTVADVSNKNLSGPQRELIQWHSKLCINMNHVQELMHGRHYKIPDDTDLVLPPILLTKNATACSCSVPRYLACGLSSQKLCSTNMSRPPVPFQQRLAFSSPICMNLATKSSPISLLFILLDDIWMVLVAMVLNAVFTEVPFTPMLHPTLFIWNARQVWEQARQLWVKQDSNKCVGTWPEFLITPSSLACSDRSRSEYLGT